MAAQTKKEQWEKHPWFKAAIEHGRAHESFCEVECNSPEWSAWSDYFDALGWAPITFPAPGSGRKWTAPTRWPNDFTAQFQAGQFGQSRCERPEPPMRYSYDGMGANLYVGSDKPDYQAMCDRAKTADRRQWCWYRDHPKWGSGIMVPLAWYQNWQGGRPSFVRPPSLTPQQILDRHAAEVWPSTHSEAAE